MTAADQWHQVSVFPALGPLSLDCICFWRGPIRVEQSCNPGAAKDRAHEDGELHMYAMSHDEYGQAEASAVVSFYVDRRNDNISGLEAAAVNTPELAAEVLSLNEAVAELRAELGRVCRTLLVVASEAGVSGEYLDEIST